MNHFVWAAGILAILMPATSSADYDLGWIEASQMRPVLDAIDAKDYPRCIRELHKSRENKPGDANLLGLLGYCHREQGDTEQGFRYYHQALAIEPDNVSINEYIGELYLRVGNLEKAREHLKIIADSGACLFGCNEYDKLKAAITAYRKANRL